MTTGEAAYEAALGHSPPDRVSVESARVRVVVDTDRGVVAEGNATVRTRRPPAAGAADAPTETRRAVTTFRYDVRADASLDRPASLGSPTLSEWAWRLFTY